MTPKAEIIYNIQRAMRRLASTDIRAEIEKWLNYEYFEMCRVHSWLALRRKTTLDFTTLGATDETGLVLPSNLFGIDRVRDNDNDCEFIRRDRADVEPDEEGYRYFTHVPSAEHTFFARDLTVVKGATTFECPSVGATTYAGYYAKFHTEPGFYLMTALKTFTPQYWGPELQNKDIVIGPSTTEKLVVMDRAEEILRDRSIDVYYWEAPKPLYNDSDLCILPISSPLELKVMIRCIGTIGRRELSADRYRGEYERALNEAKRLNPDAPRSSRPRDQHNRIFDMEQQYFGERGVETAASLRYIYRRAE